MKSNFDDDIKSILAEMHEVERESIPGKEQLKERYTLSEIFHKKMSKLCRKVEREEKIRNAARNVAATAAVIVLLFCVIKPEIVATAYEVIMREFSDHMNFKFKGDVNITEIPEYEAGYVPEGYVLDHSFQDVNAGVLVYRRDDNKLVIEYGRADGSINIDHEEMEYKIIKRWNGTEIHYFKSNSSEKDSSIMWLAKDETIVFTIIGPFSEDELLKIQKNIRNK